jgi:hypothetical protein
MGAPPSRWDAGSMLRLLALPLAAAAALALAGSASADTYCVAAPGCSGTPVGGVQGGLDAAKKHAGADTVRIGPGSYTASGLGFRYDDPSPANPITVAGAGPGNTTLTTSGHDSVVVLSVASGSANNLHISVPGGLFMQGLGLQGATGRNITVDGNAGVGATLGGGATLRGSKVAGDVGVDVFGGGSTVLNTAVTGKAIGVRVFGNATFTTLQRLRIDASDGGNQPSATGVEVDCGRIALEDSVVYVRDALPEGTGVDATPRQCAPYTPSGVVVRQSTLIGGGAGSTGVLAHSTDSALPSAVEVTNSIVRGFQHPLDREASAGGIAYLETDASDYPTQGNVDSNQSGGNGALTETAHKTVDPKFVDEVGGNFKLAPNSALIDGGNADPLAPGESNLDKAGLPRIVDGNADGIARRDVGAFEFKP